MKCGQPQCACHRDPAKRHGPYFEWTYKAKGKTAEEAISILRRARERGALPGGAKEEPGAAPVIMIAVGINNDTVNRQAWHDNFAGGTRVVKVG